MDVRVYKTQFDYSVRKSAMSFRVLYGVNCVIEFIDV